MRLYDRIVASTFEPLPQIKALGFNGSSEYAADYQGIRVRLVQTEPTILVANNVAEYFHTGVGKRPWEWDIGQDFPCLTPPWPSLFVEYKPPVDVMSRQGVKSWDPASGVAFGVLLNSHQRENTENEKVFGDLPDDARWITWGPVFVERSNRTIICVGQVFVTLRSDGTVIVGTPKNNTNLFGINNTIKQMPVEEVLKLTQGYLMPAVVVALLAITFIHCRNTRIIENTPSPKLVKATRRRHGVTPVTYKTLEIEPVKKILATEGNAAEVGQQKALHICRGHFKDYRQHGIFGKNKGLYWWGMHTRGTLDRGLVIKDYVPPVTIQ